METFSKLREEILLHKIDCIIYIFGSYLYSDNWADIDILIIYKDYKDITIIKDIFFKNLLNVPLDINFMNQDEEKYFDFIKKTDAKKIFPVEEFYSK